MTKKYSYAYTKSLYDHQYPDEKLISIHERPLADPTGKLTAIIDYEKPLTSTIWRSSHSGSPKNITFHCSARNVH